MTDVSTSDLVAVVDDAVAAWPAEPDPAVVAATAHRGLMASVLTAVVAFSEPSSRWYGQPAALRLVPAWVAALRGLQADDGLFAGGDNLASPPDTSFTVNDLALVRRLIAAELVPAHPVVAALARDLAAITARVAPALVSGGVHTPNHRWEIASALARLHQLEPSDAVLARVQEWLAEGVDAAPDGLYSERSPNYAAHVSNPCLLLLAEVLQRPDLAALVHRNLHAIAALTDEDGRVETVHSRRQDQGRAFSAAPFGPQYRRLAASGCATCAAAADAAPPLEEPHQAAHALADQMVAPTGEALPPAEPVDGDVVPFASAGLVRVRVGRTRSTVYGGSDVPALGRVASGLACDPTFLRWRSGGVVLEAVRLSRNFFGLGPCRPGPPRREVTADGSVGHRLREQVTASYYQPLPAARRRPDAVYGLEHEGRFAAAMDFARRHRHLVTLDTDLVVTSTATGFLLEAELSGAATSYALELTFRPGGELTGTRPLAVPGCSELVEGWAHYRVGDDAVELGPGAGEGPDRPPVYDPGEAYTFLGGTDATTGVKVYLTGRTPGRLRLELRVLDRG